MAKKFYLTTAIGYVNSIPHMGHTLQFVRADALARHYRKKGLDVFFLTGTDEYGSKIYRTAKEKNIEPQKLADTNSAAFKKLDDAIDISYDFFIRTTDKKNHWPGAQLIWEKMKKSGDLYKAKYRGYYCVGCEAYLDEDEIIDGKCIYHSKEPEFLEEENYFFKLSKYSDKISKLIKSGKIKITPNSRKNEALSFIKKGLKDISFSRSKKTLPWGIPVPGDSKQVIYVWADALANYISALGYGSKNLKKFKKYWPADLHIIGKDNLKFHAVYWPAMLLSAKLPLPKEVYVHGFVTSGGHKMSKSLGNVIDPIDVINKYGVDSLRYFLLREIPSFEDGDFTEDKFKSRYNGDLANGFGNFTARVLSLASKSKISASAKLDKNIGAKIKQAQKNIDKNLKELRFNEALLDIWRLISLGDDYVNKKEPWKIKNESEKNLVLLNLIILLKNIAELASPFLPQTSEKILENIEINKNYIKAKKIENLFPRIQ